MTKASETVSDSAFDSIQIPNYLVLSCPSRRPLESPSVVDSASLDPKQNCCVDLLVAFAISAHLSRISVGMRRFSDCAWWLGATCTESGSVGGVSRIVFVGSAPLERN